MMMMMIPVGSYEAISLDKEAVPTQGILLCKTSIICNLIVMMIMIIIMMMMMMIPINNPSVGIHGGRVDKGPMHVDDGHESGGGVLHIL